MNLIGTLQVPNEPDRHITYPLTASSTWSKSWDRFKVNGFSDLLGCHFYSKSTTPNIYENEISFNNGVVPFAGKLYFKSLSLELDDPDYEFRTLPYPNSIVQGNRWTIVPPQASATSFNVFLPRWYLKRRFIICPKTTPQSETDNILKYNNLFIPSRITNYGPFLMTQPAVDRNAENIRCTNNNNYLLSALQTGSPAYITGIANVQYGAFGSWMPNGEIWPGAPAGDGIYPYTGYEQCPASVLMNGIMYNLNWDRMPIACYHVDGTPYRLEDFPTFNDSIPQIMRGEPNKSGLLELTLFLDGDYNTYHYRIYNSQFSGTCPYETRLWQWQAYDIAHLRRCSHNGEAVCEYAYNPMIVEDFDVVTEYIRQSGWGNRSDSKVVPNYPGEYIPHSLKSVLYDVSTTPGQGTGVDRAFGWAMYHHALLAHFQAGNHLVPDWMKD